MNLPHIADTDALWRRVNGAVKQAFDDHPEGPSQNSIAKRVMAELLNAGIPGKSRKKKRMAPPERLLRELRGLCGRMKMIAEKPERADAIADSIRRRIEGTVSRYTILDS